MRFRICGKYWNFRFVSRMSNWGLCNYTKREITVQAGLSDEHTLDTEIHELLHAAGDFLDEDWVGTTATDIARALIRLGWTRIDKPKSNK